MPGARKFIRCAIYTRKSSEDGLEQEYNSLDAQYDACAAYAQSQRHEGWTLVKERYDDGGFSGGTMDRPALKRLLANIEAGKVDIILLYKIDRLTRSLSDFAKIVEILDKRQASFVSITQSFNTTTSMGRLTLNMLLSFAQFEREVTGERIRDKITASKRKGLWMGGPVPLGYDVLDRKLVVNENEAQLVRHIMQRYVALRSVRQLMDELDRDGHRTKVQKLKTGATRGGCSFRVGNLYHLLSNRVYRGLIVHKGDAFPGEHEAIVPEELWNEVQAKLAERSQGGSSRVTRARTGILAGLAYDSAGRALVLTHTKKGNRQFHYYANRYEGLGDATAGRVRAQDLESIVTDQLVTMLKSAGETESLLKPGTYNPGQLHELIEATSQLASQLYSSNDIAKQQLIHTMVDRIDVYDDRITITIDNPALLSKLDPTQSLQPASHNLVIERVALRLRRGKAMKLVVSPSNANCASVLRDEKLIALVAEGRATMALLRANWTCNGFVPVTYLIMPPWPRMRAG
jgi:DNA invertase Pin-like site-specific DNA recombinase